MTTETKRDQIKAKINVLNDKVESTSDQVARANLLDEISNLHKELLKLDLGDNNKHRKTTVIDAPIIADSKKRNSSATGGTSTMVRLF
jgi:hypothetical protein